jgi:hypothetical protein
MVSASVRKLTSSATRWDLQVGQQDKDKELNCSFGNFANGHF